MKVTYEWLKDFVDIKLPADELAEELTMAGLEVKGIESRAGDTVFEIEITSNRPDWLSVIGVAREVAAITGKKLKKSPVASQRSPVKKGERYSVEIEDKKDCPLYTAKIIRGVTVKASPEWLRKRLESIGCRPVNNIVDITNYVMFELGEPLHAFDRDRLDGDSIIIRRAKPQEKLVSIDGIERGLSPEIMVIADAGKAVAIAGVMGGKGAEVHEATTSVMLEAAQFNPVLVRRSRQKLGMQSEASYRLERGVDIQTVQQSSERAAQMILELAGGTKVCAASSAVSRRSPAAITIACASVTRHLGITLSRDTIAGILARLGFTVSRLRKDCLCVTVPAWRQDVKAEIDLIEEVARIRGYDAIPTTLPAAIYRAAEDRITEHIPVLKNMLMGLGLTEAVTYSLIDRKGLEGFWPDAEAPIAVANPLSQEQELLRPTLIPSLARCVAYNLRQKQERINIFEIAKTYRKTGGKIREEYAVGFALCGHKTVWLEPDFRHASDEAGLLHAKGIIDTVLARLGIARRLYRAQTDGNLIVEVDGRNVGRVLRLTGAQLASLDVKNREIFCAELSAAMLLELMGTAKTFVPFARLPGITRDISLVVKDDVSIEDVQAAIVKAAAGLVQETKVTDFYAGQHIEYGFKNLTISCFYCCADHTLIEDEVSPVHAKVIDALKTEFSAHIR
ncbi:MAG: phenylalanine--tRNA ligase subunit beta [Candidatus Omnitrophica bacterium]|nr:phenylalanine--tRNA ligase subunit beta [Candidatus Omnitrophota bacterium]